MTPLSIVRGFDYAIIGVSGTIFLYCCIAALTVVPWRRSKRESYAIKSFNGYWHARALLLLTGGLWVLVQILRLDSLWTPESVILRRRPNITSWSRQGLLCRLYLTLSLGAFQPLFLLLSLMLCQGTLSIFFDGDRWESQRHKFLHYFFATYQFGNTYSCGSQYSNQCALCVFPAVGDIVSVAFTTLFLLALWTTTTRMITAAINRRIQRRLRTFQSVLLSTLVGGEALRTCTLVSTPYHWTFQMLWVMYWLDICLLVTITTWLLVIQPVRSARKAAKEHEAWLDEPQELATLDTGKSDPLLGNDTTKADILTPIKEGKEDQVSSKAMDEAVTDSVTQRRVAEKLSQV